MFKKIVGVMVAALMVASCATVAASAAEADQAAAAADQSSIVAAADESSQVAGAEDDSKVSGADKSNSFNFEVPSDWKNVKVMYCHVYMCVDDGSVKWPAWKTKAEKMEDNGDGTWSYDVSKLPAGAIDPAKGASYAVVFAADTGMQTYNLLLDSNCIGDTAYVTGNSLENPADSNKTAIEARWRNSSLGPEKVITTIGNVIGDSLPEGSSNAILMANWLKSWALDDTKTGAVPNLMTTLGVSADEVYAELVKLCQQSVDNGSMTADEMNQKLAKSAELMGLDSSKAEEIQKTAEKEVKNNNGSGSNGSGSSGSGSTGSVSSGQDSTVLFVLGGIMLAAAATLFVTRRRRED